MAEPAVASANPAQDQFELARKKALQAAQSVEQQQREALQRRFASLGGLGSGASIKAEAQLAEQHQAARENILSGIRGQELESQTRLKEIEAGRQFEKELQSNQLKAATEEAVKQRQFLSEEAAKQGAAAAQQAEIERQFQIQQGDIARQFAGREAAAARLFSTQEREATQVFQERLASVEQAFRDKVFDFDKRMRLDEFAQNKYQFNVQTELAQKGLSFQERQVAIQEAQQNLAQQSFEFTKKLEADKAAFQDKVFNAEQSNTYKQLQLQANSAIAEFNSNMINGAIALIQSEIIDKDKSYEIPGGGRVSAFQKAIMSMEQKLGKTADYAAGLKAAIGGPIPRDVSRSIKY